MKPWYAALALAAVAPVAALAQEEKPSLDDRFFKAFYQENGLRDFEKAASLYAEAAAAARAAKDPATELKALLGRGRCLRTMGKVAEAKMVFEAALALDASNEEAKKALADADTPAGIDEALRERIGFLVRGLSGSQHDQAKQDLLRIGARAVPLLEEGLRGLDVGVVAGAAEVLAAINAPGARGALARALNDPKVTFPRMVAQGVSGLSSWSYEEDPEGRILLLREVLRIPDRKLLERTLTDLMRMGFRPKEGPAVAAVVAEALATADDEGKGQLLAAAWSAEARVNLLPAMRPLLASSDPFVRARAIDMFACAPKEMSSEDAAAVRAALDRGTPSEKWNAYRILDGRNLLEEPSKGEVFSGLLSCDDVAVVELALGWLNSTAGQPSRWTASFGPGYLAGYRKALAGAYRVETLQQFAGLLPQGAGASLAEDDLIDLVARCKGLPRLTGATWTETYASQAAALRVQQGTDAEAVSAAFLRGYRRLEGAQRIQWCSPWWGKLSSTFTNEVVQTLAGDETTDQPRQWAYNELLTRAAVNAVPATPAMLGCIGKDLLGAGAQANQALRLADAYASPALAEAVRGLIARTNRDQVVNRLALLVKCVGRDAAPDIRERLGKARDDGNFHFLLLDLLVKCLGKDAVPDVREALKSANALAARDHLVRLLGVESVPDLLELAEGLGGIHKAVCQDRIVKTGETSSIVWGPAVPPAVMEDFVERLPAEKRTGPLLEGALGSLSEAVRSTVVQESLDSKDAGVLTQAVKAVRRYNMVDLWPRLVPLLDHSDESVRSEARESLDAIRKYRELKATFERFGEGGAGKAFEDAIALSKSGEATKRKAAALALGALGDPAGVAPLLKLVEDEDASVREAALAALERLGGAKK